MITGPLPVRYLPYGDSKTASWDSKVLAYAVEPTADRGCYRVSNLYHAGFTTVQLAGAIDADLTAYATVPPSVVLMNAGVNDDGITESNWKTAYAYCLDAFHTAWSATLIYCCRVWSRGHVTACNTIDDSWLPAVLAARSWCQLGFDERVFIPGDDNGATNTTDGTHLTAAGYALWNANWISILNVPLRT